MSSNTSRMKDRVCALEDCFANRITGDGTCVCMLLKSSYANYEICPFYKSKSNINDRYVDFCKEADRETYEYAENRIGELRDAVKSKEFAIKIMKAELEKDKSRLILAKSVKARLYDSIEEKKRKNELKT